MLPTQLSTQLCSLWSQTDRLALSVTWLLDAHTLALLHETHEEDKDEKQQQGGSDVTKEKHQLDGMTQHGEQREVRVAEVGAPDSQAWSRTPMEFHRSLIHSRYKMTYAAAQELCDILPTPPLGVTSYVDDTNSITQEITQRARELLPELQHTADEQQPIACRVAQLIDALQQLSRVAQHVEAERLNAGGLQLEGLEVEVAFDRLDEEAQQQHAHTQKQRQQQEMELRGGEMRDLRQKPPLRMHETIAELMILANRSVAQRILTSYPTRACLRRHPPPRLDHFAALLTCAHARNFRIRTGSNKQLADSLNAAVDPADPLVNTMMRNLATQAMSNAAYFSTGSVRREDYAHYGLALATYTHFTSPIRRYADILVHRLLLASMARREASSLAGLSAGLNAAAEAADQLEESLMTDQQLTNQCAVMNQRHRMAQCLQRASIELFQAKFFQNQREEQPITSEHSCEAEGIIVQIKRGGALVIHVTRYGIRGTVLLRQQQQLQQQKPQSGDQSDVLHSNKQMQQRSGLDRVSVIGWRDTASSSYQSIAFVEAGNEFKVEEGSHGNNTNNSDNSHGNSDTMMQTGDESGAAGVSVSVIGRGERQTYCLFDHVRVRVHVVESVAHGLSLRLHLIGYLGVPARTGTSSSNQKQMQEHEMMEKVKQLELKRVERESQQAKLEEEEREEKNNSKRSHSTTNDEEECNAISQLHRANSIYQFFRNLRVKRQRISEELMN